MLSKREKDDWKGVIQTLLIIGAIFAIILFINTSLSSLFQPSGSGKYLQQQITDLSEQVHRLECRYTNICKWAKEYKWNEYEKGMGGG